MMVIKKYGLELDTNGTLLRICGKGVCDVERTPAEELDQKTRSHMARTGVKEYAEAMRAVLRSEPDLKARYAGLVDRPRRGEAVTPAEEVDRRTRQYMRERGEKSYSVAMHAVLDADPELKEAYAW